MKTHNRLQHQPPASARSFASQFLVLLCLTGFAITEPALRIFGDSPGIFYFHNVASASLLIAYALTVALVPALLMQTLTVIVGRMHNGLALALHLFWVGLLAGLWLIQLAKWSFGVTSEQILLAFFLLGSVTFVLLITRWPIVNNFLKMAAIAPLGAVIFFLGLSNTSALTRAVDLSIAPLKSDVPLPSVVFVLLDEFPTLGLLNEHGLIDEHRYPHLSAVASQSTWYRHYTVLSGRTDYSVPSILAGVAPTAAAANIENYPNNLFSLLAPTHFLTAFETLTNLCALPQCSEGSPGTPIQKPAVQFGTLLSTTASVWLSRVALAQRGESRLDDFEEELADTESLDEKTREAFFKHFLGPSGLRATQVKPKRLEKFVATFVKAEQPALYFLHLEMPHLPWRFSDKGELYDLPNTRLPMSPENSDGGQWLAQLSEYRFLLQAQYTDSLIGDIQQRLQSQGMWDDALVVVTADHGRSFRLNTSGRILGPDTYDSIAYVPLLIKLPNQTHGNIDDSNLMAYDLLPTIADALGINIPWKPAGFPVGDYRIADRGDQKASFPAQVRRSRGVLKVGGSIQGERQFSDKAHFPQYSSRWIGARGSADDSLILLNQGLDLQQYIGHTVDEFEVRPGGPAVVDELALLQRPSPDKPPLGIVMGNIEFPPKGRKVVIGVNGRLVTGSPLVNFKGVSNTFIAMLPPGVLKAENNIAVYLVEEEQLLELDIH